MVFRFKLDISAASESNGRAMCQSHMFLFHISCPHRDSTNQRTSLTTETERLLVGPLKTVMDHINEAFHHPRRRSSISSSTALGASSAPRGQERMEWGRDGLGIWVASLAEQVWSRSPFFIFVLICWLLNQRISFGELNYSP